MPAIMQPLIFGWQEFEASPDIKRLQSVLRGLDASALLDTLQAERKGRRDDYPLVAVWNSMFAGLMLGHETFAGLIRELKRNAELRQVCGFDPMLGAAAVPSPFAYSRMMAKLVRHEPLVRRVFDSLVGSLAGKLPDLGRILAVDGKALPTRRVKDPEAAEGLKTDTDGRVTMSWFGYKLHLICDATHELPLAFEVTAANVADSPRMMPLVESLEAAQPDLAKRATAILGDRGYDDGGDKQTLARDNQIMPIIPARDLAKGKHQPLNPERHDTIYVSPTGQVCCRVRPMDPRPEAEFCPMQLQGYEKDRETLKFRCPAAALGVECHNKDACASASKDQGFGRVVRVPLDRAPRLFTPVYAHSDKFADLYKMRTSIERLFYRLDHFYGMERQGLRGLVKVRLRVTMALSAMLATATAWLEGQRPEKIRSKFQAAVRPKPQAAAAAPV